MEEINLKRWHTIWVQLYEHSIKSKTRETVKRSVVVRNKDEGGGKGGRDAQKIFRAVNYSVWYGGYIPLHIYQTHRVYNIRNPNANYRLWVTVTCQCRFTVINGPLWQVADSGGKLCMCGDRGYYIETLYFPLNFDVNLKLL